MPDNSTHAFVNDYVPHTLPPVQRELKKKQIVISNIQRVQQLASETPVQPVHVLLHREKKDLREQSQMRINTWGNTIMGARKKRLAASEAKQRELEQMRQKMDEEWAEIAKQEKEQAIQRARLLQRAEDPRVKLLHSQLLMSNVLYERDMQREAKYKQQLANMIREKEDILKMRFAQIEKGEKQDQLMQKKEQARLEYAQCIRQDMKKREEARSHESDADKLYEAKLLQSIIKEQQERKVYNHLKKLQIAEEIKSDLSKAIMEKQDRERHLKQQVKALDSKNEAFNDMKDMFGERRKQFIQHQVNQRLERGEIVADINLKEQQEQDLVRNAYLEISVHSKDHVDDDRSRREHDKKQAAIASIKQFKEEHQKKKERLREMEKTAKIKERQEMLKEETRLKTEVLERVRKREKMMEESKEARIHHLQILEDKKKQDLLDRKERERKELQDRLDDQAQFEAYAADMVSSWIDMGRNVAPVLKTLEKEKPGYVPRKRGDMKQDLNTFKRLGFSVKYTANV